MRLHCHFFIPSTTIVLFQSLAFIFFLPQKVVYERITFFQRQVGIIFLIILNIPLPLVCVNPGNSLFFPWRIEISDDFGLLGCEINLIGFQLLEQSIAHNVVFLLSFGFSSLWGQIELKSQLLGFLLVHLGDASVCQWIVSAENSHLKCDYNHLRTMEDEEARLHKEKWKIWNEQIRKKMNVQDGMENYAVNLIQKMSNTTNKNNEKNAQQLNKKITHQIQSNICSICLDLMIPPDRQPMILFPCGHNICKDCLFQHPPKGLIKKNLKLKLDKCSLCRQKIESYALNQSLMTLICTYTNNKELIEKEEKRLQQAEQQQESENPNFQYIKIRCNILENEHLSLSAQAEKYTKTKNILHDVIQTLKHQKKKNEREMEKLEEEAKLISKCLTQKVQQMQFLQKKLKEVQDKYRVVEKALIPLKKEKEKQELLEVARLLDKK